MAKQVRSYIDRVDSLEARSRVSLEKRKGRYQRDSVEKTLRARFLSQTIAFLMGHWVARFVCSLTLLTPLICSAALCFATLTSLARSVHGLAHSLGSLPRGTVEILENVFTL